MGIVTISGDSASFALLQYEGQSPWTGSGSYYIMLILNINDEGSEKGYVYANGTDVKNITTYSISSASTTIPFAKFAEVPAQDS